MRETTGELAHRFHLLRLDQLLLDPLAAGELLAQDLRVTLALCGQFPQLRGRRDHGCRKSIDLRQMRHRWLAD